MHRAFVPLYSWKITGQIIVMSGTICISSTISSVDNTDSVWTATMTGSSLLPKAATWESTWLLENYFLTLCQNLSPYNFQRLFLCIPSGVTNQFPLPQDNISISGTISYLLPSLLQVPHYEFSLLQTENLFFFFNYFMCDHGFQTSYHLNHSSLNICQVFIISPIQEILFLWGRPKITPDILAASCIHVYAFIQSIFTECLWRERH